MAELKKEYKLKGGEVTKQGAEFLFTEIDKEEERDYNLSKILDSLVGERNISITIVSQGEVATDDV